MLYARLSALAVFVVLRVPSAYAQAGGRWEGEQCDLKTGHFLVSSAVVHLKSAVETKFEDQRQQKLDDAERALRQALETGGQSENPAAWYYLGRYYLLRGDVPGADSALTRATALRPECDADVNKWRRYSWVPILNAGIAAWQAGNVDSAVASFRKANTLYRGEPQGLFYLAQLHAGRDATDSAITYFRLGIDVAGDDTAFATQKQQAIFNLARMYHREQAWVQAAATYGEYLRLSPGDAEATAALASVYSAMGKPDSATVLYRALLERADSAHFLDLMQAGVQMYRAATQAEGVAARETYEFAARAFRAALTKNPFYRDGLYNLANVYYQLRDTTAMLPVARRLVQLDPLNRAAVQLLAQAFQFAGQGDSSLHYLRFSNERLPVDVTVSGLRLDAGQALVTGVVTNFHTVASAGVTLVFEFLSNAGTSVSTAILAVPPLDPQGNHPFKVLGTGEGIVGYRYHPQE